MAMAVIDTQVKIILVQSNPPISDALSTPRWNKFLSDLIYQRFFSPLFCIDTRAQVQMHRARIIRPFSHTERRHTKTWLYRYREKLSKSRRLRLKLIPPYMENGIVIHSPFPQRPISGMSLVLQGLLNGLMHGVIVNKLIRQEKLIGPIARGCLLTTGLCSFG